MYLGWDVEAVALLGVELRSVEDDSDLTLEHHENHRVLVRARHPLGRVSLDPRQRNRCQWLFIKEIRKKFLK